MNKREAMLRELNLYPQWVRRTTSDVLEKPVSIKVESGKKNVSAAATVMMPVESLLEQPFRPSSEIEDLGWTELQQRVRDCSACKLRSGCKQTVFGVGDEKADWLFVGEGPGADEDAMGEPFVGQAGKLLDSMLMAIKLKRGNNVYIANIVKCRPPANRVPEADEIAQCLPFLQRQIELIQPKVIVALGRTAAISLLMKPLISQTEELTTLAQLPLTGKEISLGSLRGKLHDYQGIPLIATYHPAYLLRSPAEKLKAWQDLCFAVKVLSEVKNENA